MRRSDTASEIEATYNEMWRKLSPEERFLKGLALMRMSRLFFAVGLRERYPHASEQGLRDHSLKELYGFSLPQGL